MVLIKSVLGKTPSWGKSCFLADNATLIGDVIMGDQCSVWFNVVIRGDVNYIRIGTKVNIQDGVVIHGTYEKAATEIGNNVSIGHNAMLHGCTVHDNVLIGMGAIVMDNAVVEKNSIVAAGAVILENTIVKSGSVFAGVPAKKVKNVNPALFNGEIQRIAENYELYSSWYAKE
jgi:carbonic anhydrase/acetyltransferase-like protein (isoleucine patch superfamily)